MNDFHYSVEQINMLRLIRTPKIGRQSFFELIEYYGNATDSIKNITDRFSIVSKEMVLNEIKLANRYKAKFIFFNDAEYPQILKLTDDFPPIINVIGNIAILNQSNIFSVAVVGSRNASVISKKFTQYIVKELTMRNFIIVSGMAYGIDQIAHETNMDISLKYDCANDLHKTIAVVGSGLQDCYPNNVFARKILNCNGVLISELAFNAPAKKENFPRRNRIISGLSIATIVIEANISSGSIITAKYAAQQGRLVFAVPGFPLDEKSAGTNQLIKDGAVMLRNIDDFLSENGQFSSIEMAKKSLKDEKYQQQNLSFFDDNDNNFEKKEEFLKKKVTVNVYQNEYMEDVEQDSLNFSQIIVENLDYKIPTNFDDIFYFIKKQFPKLNFNQKDLITYLIYLETEDLVKKDLCGGFIRL